VDREENRAEQARRDEIVEQLGEFLGVAVLDDPEQDRSAQVLFGLPALEGGGELGGMVMLNKEVDALGGKLALGNLEQVENDVAGLDRRRHVDQVEVTALKVDRDVLGDAGEVADLGDEGGLGGFELLGG